MTEQLAQQSHEQEHSAEAHNQSVEKLNELIEQGKKSRHEQAEKLDELKAETHNLASSAQETISRQSEQANNAPQSSPLVNKELKDLKFSRTLQSVRKDLSKPERVLSEVVHNKTVDAVSGVADKTIARPSGLFSGGLCAFLGSGVYLYITKHYGYEYNFLFFVFLFIGGFGLGLIIELVLFVLRRRKA